MYLNLYNSLCMKGKSKKSQYKKFSGLHKHHITPKHSGGDDADENLTYLTVREHIIAHFLLWKIYRNTLDIGAMKMLGAKITPSQRRQLGLWCVENKIGIHGWSEEQKLEHNKTISKKTSIRMRDEKKGFHAHTPEERKIVASNAGKLGGAMQVKNKLGIHAMSLEDRKVAGKRGSDITTRKYKNSKRMNNGVEERVIIFDDIPKYLESGYIIGPLPKAAFRKLKIGESLLIKHSPKTKHNYRRYCISYVNVIKFSMRRLKNNEVYDWFEKDELFYIYRVS